MKCRVMKKRELLAGGIVRDLWFRNEDEFQKYFDMIPYDAKILDKAWRADGSLIVRLLTPYNNAPLIQLYEED